MQTSTEFAWEGNAADAPYPLRQRLDAGDTPKCFKILGGRAAEGQAGSQSGPTALPYRLSPSGGRECRCFEICFARTSGRATLCGPSGGIRV